MKTLWVTGDVKTLVIWHDWLWTWDARTQPGILGPVSIYRPSFLGIRISIIKLRWLWDLILIMGITVLVRQHFYIETTHRSPMIFSLWLKCNRNFILLSSKFQPNDCHCKIFAHNTTAMLSTATICSDVTVGNVMQQNNFAIESNHI